MIRPPVVVAAAVVALFDLFRASIDRILGRQDYHPDHTHSHHTYASVDAHHGHHPPAPVTQIAKTSVGIGCGTILTVAWPRNRRRRR